MYLSPALLNIEQGGFISSVNGEIMNPNATSQESVQERYAEKGIGEFLQSAVLLVDQKYTDTKNKLIVSANSYWQEYFGSTHETHKKFPLRNFK